MRFHAGAGAVAGRLGPRHEGAAGHEGGAGAPHPHRGHDGAQGASGTFAQAVGRALLAGKSSPPGGVCSGMISMGPGREGGAGQHRGFSWARLTLAALGGNGAAPGAADPGWSSPFVSWTGC